MDTQEKADFLRNQYTKMLSQLDVNAPRKWGKMNVQQMIEHMSEYVRIANGRILPEMITPEERVASMQAFLNSEKQMRENTPNPLLPDIPPPAKCATKQEAIDELQAEINHFFNVHEKDANRKTPNPFFGVLDYDLQVKLLYKHGIHHLRQYGAVE